MFPYNVSLSQQTTSMTTKKQQINVSGDYLENSRELKKSFTSGYFRKNSGLRAKVIRNSSTLLQNDNDTSSNSMTNEQLEQKIKDMIQVLTKEPSKTDTTIEEEKSTELQVKETAGGNANLLAKENLPPTLSPLDLLNNNFSNLNNLFSNIGNNTFKTDKLDLENNETISVSNTYVLNMYKDQQKNITLEKPTNYFSTYIEKLSYPLFDQNIDTTIYRSSKKEINDFTNVNITGLLSQDPDKKIEIGNTYNNGLSIKKGIRKILSQTNLNALDSIFNKDVDIDLSYCAYKLATSLTHHIFSSNVDGITLDSGYSNNNSQPNWVELPTQISDLNNILNTDTKKQKNFFILGPNKKSQTELLKFIHMAQPTLIRKQNIYANFCFDDSKQLPPNITIYSDDINEASNIWNSIGSNYFTNQENIKSIYQSLSDYFPTEHYKKTIIDLVSTIFLENYFSTKKNNKLRTVPYNVPDWINIIGVEKDEMYTLEFNTLMEHKFFLDSLNKSIQIHSLIILKHKDNLQILTEETLSTWNGYVNDQMSGLNQTLENAKNTTNYLKDYFKMFGIINISYPLSIYGDSIDQYITQRVKINKIRQSKLWNYEVEHTISIFPYIYPTDMYFKNTISEVLKGVVNVRLYIENDKLVVKSRTVREWLLNFASNPNNSNMKVIDSRNFFLSWNFFENGYLLTPEIYSSGVNQNYYLEMTYFSTKYNITDNRTIHEMSETEPTSKINLPLFKFTYDTRSTKEQRTNKPINEEENKKTTTIDKTNKLINEEEKKKITTIDEELKMLLLRNGFSQNEIDNLKINFENIEDYISLKNKLRLGDVDIDTVRSKFSSQSQFDEESEKLIDWNNINLNNFETRENCTDINIKKAIDEKFIEDETNETNLRESVHLKVIEQSNIRPILKNELYKIIKRKKRLIPSKFKIKNINKTRKIIWLNNNSEVNARNINSTYEIKVYDKNLKAVYVSRIRLFDIKTKKVKLSLGYILHKILTIDKKCIDTHELKIIREINYKGYLSSKSFAIYMASFLTKALILRLDINVIIHFIDIISEIRQATKSDQSKFLSWLEISYLLMFSESII